MPSRLWTVPPLKSDGSLDYARLTLAEICEDLAESLLDCVINGGQQELQPLLDELPEFERIPAHVLPPAALVRTMEGLLRLEGEADGFHGPRGRELLGQAVRELREASGST